MNELMIFEGKELEVLEFEGKILFNAKQVGEILEIKNVNDNISKMNEKQVFKLTNSIVKDTDFRKLHNTGENFLTESGVSVLISKANKISIKMKQKIIKSFNDNGYNLNLVALTRKEIEFFELLEGVLEPFEYICHKQYSVNGKRIDFYIEDLNIAIEYDEDNHSSYSYENQEERQKMIEKELGCKFIRLSDEESNAYNVGLVMKGLAK